MTSEIIVLIGVDGHRDGFMQLGTAADAIELYDKDAPAPQGQSWLRTFRRTEGYQDGGGFSQLPIFREAESALVRTPRKLILRDDAER